MKEFIIAGNWKMNTTVQSSALLAAEIEERMPEVLPDNVRVVVCPPFTSIVSVWQQLAVSEISLGAQNCHTHEKGAFTGEISAEMLSSCGCEYVIVGHSERRKLFGETDFVVNQKIQSALDSGIIPIFCVGETLEERQSNSTFSVIKKQIEDGLEAIEIEFADELVIAYEPVWAIGTGLAATSAQAEEVHSFIRSLLEELFGEMAEEICILYGGSMTETNAKELLSQKNVNGGLIGGASLKANSFVNIIQAAIDIADED